MKIIKCPVCGTIFDVTKELNKFKLELIQATEFMKEVNKLKNRKTKKLSLQKDNKHL